MKFLWKQKSYWFYLVWSILFIVGMLIFLTGCYKDTRSLNLFIWGNYLDPNIVKDFETKYDIRVNIENYDSSEILYAKFKNVRAYYDILVPSEYMMQKMLYEELLEKLDYQEIPNARYVDKRYHSFNWDKKGSYFIPYLINFLGIIYHPERVSSEPTVQSLWSRQYQGRITMIDGIREAVGVSLLSLGYHPQSTQREELELAKEHLINQKELIFTYGVDILVDIMIREEADLSLMYTNDAFTVMKNNPHIKYTIMKPGIFSIDTFVLAKDAPNKKNAYLFLNYLLDPAVNAQNALTLEALSPNTGAQEYLKTINPDLFDFYPKEDFDLSQYTMYRDLGDSNYEYEKIWDTVLNY